MPIPAMGAAGAAVLGAALAAAGAKRIRKQGPENDAQAGTSEQASNPDDSESA
jgi:hypothetical protein